MLSEQKYKAAARQSAASAPKADAKTAKRAVQDAAMRRDRLPGQKLAQSLDDAGGSENRHHEKDQIISEFDDPSQHTVQAGY